MAPVKRKRSDRTSVDSGDNRPSPHRPANTNLAQYDQNGSMGRGGGGGGGGGGNRRQSRGGNRASRGRNDRMNSSDSSAPAMLASMRGTPGPMSPPVPRPSSSSQSQAPTNPQAVPISAPIVISPAPEEPRPDPTPYDYSHITDERVAGWTTNGRKELVEAGKQALDDVDILDLSALFQELIQATLDRRLDANDAGTCVKEILGSETTPAESTMESCDGPSLFLDSLSILTESERFDTVLQRFFTSSGVSPALARRILDTTLLEKLGLTRNTFFRAGVRQATNLYYRQSNHNLLREETEGYSKLTTELFTSSSNEQPTSENVEDTFERVKGLIGTFDLDVGRVLDVTLDAFATLLIKHFRFFVKFLRVSSWWPRDAGLNRLLVGGYEDGGLPRWALPGSSVWETTAEEEQQALPRREERDRIFWERARKVHLDAFFELGGRQVIDTETRDLFLARKSQVDSDIGPDRQWIETTGTAPPLGNRVAAQLLGFKLRFYASEAREPEDLLPSNLMYLAALLIKIGFISLRDLYPHLWPVDGDMPAFEEAKKKELAEKTKANRSGGATNALMMAGALADDTLPNGGRIRDTVPAKGSIATTETTAPEIEEKRKLPEPEDTKVKLLINLLTIGAIPESLFILGRFPWIPEAFPEVLDLLHRILHHSINKVFEACLIPELPSEDCPLKKSVDSDQSSTPKGQVRRSETLRRKLLKWPFPDKHDVHDANNYRFYWDEWADNIPVCQNIDDIFTLCSTLLNCSGVNIGKDVTLLSKLYTIGNASLAQDRSEANLVRWQDLLKRLLVPALSLTKSNANIVNELYDMLRYYPLTVRYTLYAEWFEGSTSRLPALVATFAHTKVETMSIMKRISKTNTTEMARKLAKIAYASPGIVFKVAIGQIESYSNLIEVVVECAKYFTDLGYDVLIWTLLSSLGGKSRDRTRSDDVLLASRWLIALSKFSGMAFKRYSIMNPSPVIQYINDQLYRGNATDLLILEELISQMTGIICDTDFTDSQLLAMTGGEKLRRQTLINLQDKRFESEKSAKRLMRSLLETKLAAPILVSIAQHRQSAVFAVPEDEAHIKYLSTLLDETQRILVQYLDFLRSNLTVDQFDAIVPNTTQLMSEYGLDPALAFLIGRASFARRMIAVDPASPSELTKEQPITDGFVSTTDIEGDVSMDSIEITESSTVDMIDAVSRASHVPVDTWKETLTPLVSAVRDAVPETTWTLLSPDFYVVFWQLALSDIHLPMDSYTSENARLSREQMEIMNDRSDMTRKGVDKNNEKRKAIDATRAELMKESKQQLMNYEKVRGRLNKEKATWFINIDVKPDVLNDALLEQCILPRLLLSPSDCDYCFKLIKFLHNSGTPHFRTLSLYSRIFKPNRLRTLIFSSTLREAEYLGRFLKQILADLARWHSNKAFYEREAIGQNRDLPGFAMKLEKDHKPQVFLEYEEFRRWVFNCHKSLNAALRECLSGTEWMQIRNAITVLKAVVEVFPSIDFMGKAFQNLLFDVGKREKGKRADLSLTANAVLPDLKKREGKWVMMQAFAMNLGEPSSQANGPGKAAIPQPDAVPKTVLKPTASEFKPGAHIIPNGSSTPNRAAKAEVEDGEVDDANAIKAPESLHGGNATTLGTPNMPQQSVSNLDSNSTVSTQEVLSRGGTPKPSSALSSQSGPPPRPDIGRIASSVSILDKPPAGLPSRPDVPFPGRSNVERHPQPRPDDRRDGRPRDRGREPMNSDRRPLDPPGRDSGRYADRGAHEREQGRDRLEPPRRFQDPIRDGRDRDGRDSRDTRDRDRGLGDMPRPLDPNGRLARTDPMHLPRVPMVEPERGPLFHSDRGVPISPNDVPINPARAKLFHGSTEPPISDSSRPREDIGGRPSSRPHSPRRSERPGDIPEGRRNDRGPSGRYPGPDLIDGGRGRPDDQLSSGPPRGDRLGDRTGNRGPERGLRDSSAFQPNPTPPRNQNPDHGRLNTDSNYGRLEGPSLNSDIPSGPRASTARDARDSRGRGRHSVNTPMNAEPIPASTADKAPPTGPANHAPRHSGPGQFDTQSTSVRSIPPPISGVSVPNPPQPLPPLPVGVHPSRLGNVSPAESGVHPDRLNAIKDQNSSRPPLPIQTNIRHEPTVPSPMSGLAPSGPRGQQSPSATPMGPNVFSVPTGPSANERTRSTRERQGHHLAGIQNILQAPNPPAETRIRGRGNFRGPSFDSHPPSGSPTSVSTVPTDIREGTVDRRDLANPDRKELFTSRSTNGLGSDHGREDDLSRSLGRDLMQGADRPHRSARHGNNHRTSSSRSPSRDNQRPVREREPLEPPREHRDRGRRSEGGRDRHQGGERDGGRRDGRDVDKARDVPQRLPNEPVWGGDNTGGPERTGRSREIRQSSGVGESRRDSRGSRDADGGSGRKRRVDEGGMAERGHEKRTRR